MSAFLAWIVKYLPMILSLLSTLGGLVTSSGAVASHFHLQGLHQQAVSKGMAAAPELSSAFMTHVVGQGAGGVTLLMAAVALFFGQGHSTSAFKALAAQRQQIADAFAKFQAAEAQRQKVADITAEVHTLPIPDAAGLVKKIGTDIGGVLKHLTGN